MSSLRRCCFFAIACAATLLGSRALATGSSAARELSFDARVRAQEAIERVYYSHQLGATAPFEKAVPREVLVRKVLTYLRQSAALERYWHTPVTSLMLRREIERMARQSRLPERLRELYAALDDDPVLIQECLARPSLVDRLTRSFFASDHTLHGGEHEHRSWEDWWSAVGPTLDPTRISVVASAQGLPSVPSACTVGDVWENGGMNDVPDPRNPGPAVWTGSLVLIWGGNNDYNLFASGARYDPATDTWSPMSAVGQPAGRQGHTALWTGSEMIVWGGAALPNNQLEKTGGRYDPVTDTWKPTSTVGAPTARFEHASVWTGEEMIVWGGQDGPYDTNTGGRYRPSTDSWRPTSIVNAPEPREKHSAVWTGSRMVVWGGSLNTIPTFYYRTGGLYDPVSDTWTPTSITNAPEPRDGQSAVWTGEVMIIWGGYVPTGHYYTGGRYDPATDTWVTVSTMNAPPGQATAIWTGTEMLIWGGANLTGTLVQTGARYDPVSDTWRAISTINAPSPRSQHARVWAGDRMIVWGGGEYYGATNTGGRYDPVTDSWTPTFAGTAPSGRQGHTAVWTGTLMLIWGGSASAGDPAVLDGGRYDPAIDAWSPMSNAGRPPVVTYGHTALWTGQEMIVWGGGGGSVYQVDTGGRYDPIGDAWKPVTTTGSPSPRVYHSAIWTGSRMMIWGGSAYDPATFTHTYLDTGAAYDPGTDTWSPMTITGAPVGRQQHSAVWTGSSMLVWGGSTTISLGAGGAYDPVADRWSTMSVSGEPTARAEHTAVWTGNEMIVWGGNGGTGLVNTGGRYSPSSDSWLALPTANAPAPRWHHAAVWTGDEMIVWGGWVPAPGGTPQMLFNDGGRYDPAANTWSPTSVIGAPGGRRRASAVWTGSQMIVWGGAIGSFAFASSGGRYCVCDARFYSDDDGDGFGDPTLSVRACIAPPGYVSAGTDCNDKDAGSWATPGEVRNLLLPDPQSISWDPPSSPGASSILFDVLRAIRPSDFISGTVCVVSDTPNLTATDEEMPTPGVAFFYLVRAQDLCPNGQGPLGKDSNGTLRSGRTCP